MVSIGDVTTWDTGCTPREQAEKMMEEVMEVFAIIDQNGLNPATRCDVLRECADVVQATCNLVAMVSGEVLAVHGAGYFEQEMAACLERQRERGRL